MKMQSIKKIILGLILLIFLYVGLMYILALIPVNKNISMSMGCKPVTIFISTNGVHSDFIVPFKNEYFDWSKKILVVNVLSKKLNPNFLSVGWGDKGFYLDIEEWRDLDFKTAFKAGFGLGQSAMHVTFIDQINLKGDCKKIELCADDYLKLVAYIIESFQVNNKEEFSLIPNAS